MKMRIHFKMKGAEDHYDLVGDTVTDIRNKNIIAMKSRKLDTQKNEMWLERVG
jgi:hypothetical protein